MRSARLALLALAAATAAPGRVCAATPPPVSTGTTKDASSAAAAAGAAAGCAVPAPLPLLNKAFYPDHAFKYGRDNTATETMSSGTVHLEIQFAGCTDGYEHAFVFTDDEPLSSYDDRDHWLLFASRQIAALKTWRRGRDDVKDLLDFLSGAKIATTRKSGSEIRLEMCRDGSPAAENGCSMKSGGGWRFAVRKLEDNRIEVYASRYLALPAFRAGMRGL